MIVAIVEGLIKKVIGVQPLAGWKRKFIPISRDQLTLGGAVPPESARLPVSKHRNTQHRRHGYNKGAARALRMHLYHFVDGKT